MNLLISSSAKNTIKNSATLAKQLGLGLEISRIPLYKTKDMTVQDVVDNLKNNLDDFNNPITFHAMFTDLNISSSDIEIREISRKRFIQSFEIAKEIGAKTVLYHSGYKGTKHKGSIYLFKKAFCEFWTDFIKEFEKSNIIAVIENVFETMPEFCLEMNEKVASPNFKLAIDCGHVNLYAKDTKISDWIEKYGKRLYHMHIHNNFRENDDHSNLLNGTIDYKEVFKAIQNEGINPSIVLEMFSEEDILTSVKYIKENLNYK